MVDNPPQTPVGHGRPWRTLDDLHEPQLLARMAASGRACAKDTVGIRLVYSADHWDYYAIDHSCFLTSAARERHSGALG
jgi:hypothetical protein